MERKNNFSTWIRQWNQGEFDFSEKLSEEKHPRITKSKAKDHDWTRQFNQNIEKREISLFNHLYPVLSVVMAIMMIVFMMMVVVEMPKFADAQTPPNSSEVIKRYIEKGLDETGAVNIVAGVILDYRAFDTLGESHVLFTASMVVTSLLLLSKPKREKAEEEKITTDDVILQCTAKVLVPLVIMFGAYVILAGHLGPGGGFSGGSIIGGGLILYCYAFGSEKLEKVLSFKRYRYICLSALGFYSFAKCYSFFCGANHLETIFKNGTPGAILSAGLILPLNIAVGIVVALTMYGFYSYFTRGRI